jgi:hypothetical protein
MLGKQPPFFIVVVVMIFKIAHGFLLHIFQNDKDSLSYNVIFRNKRIGMVGAVSLSFCHPRLCSAPVETPQGRDSAKMCKTHPVCRQGAFSVFHQFSRYTFTTGESLRTAHQRGTDMEDKVTVLLSWPGSAAIKQRPGEAEDCR